MVTRNSIFWEQLLDLGFKIEKAVGEFQKINEDFDKKGKEVVDKVDENLVAQQETSKRVSESLREAFDDMEMSIANRVVDRVTRSFNDKADEAVGRITDSSHKIVSETRSEVASLVQKAITEKQDTKRIKWLSIASFCVLCLMIFSSIATYYVVRRSDADMNHKAAAVKTIYGEHVFDFLSKNNIRSIIACDGMKKVESKSGQIWCYPINNKNEVIPFRIE